MHTLEQSGEPGNSRNAPYPSPDLLRIVVVRCCAEVIKQTAFVKYHHDYFISPDASVITLVRETETLLSLPHGDSTLSERID